MGQSSMNRNCMFKLHIKVCGFGEEKKSALYHKPQELAYIIHYALTMGNWEWMFMHVEIKFGANYLLNRNKYS